MTFKEVFQRYKEGTASLEEIKFVEEELEKFELLEEYTQMCIRDRIISQKNFLQSNEVSLHSWLSTAL